MEDLWARIVTDLAGRLDGPLSLRFLLQPTVASILAIRDGLADARAGRPPYFWSMLSGPVERRAMLREGWRSVTKVFLLACVFDVAYQLLVFRRVYPVEALLVAGGLAFIPYLLLRGPVTRIMR
jgi:hypothetical protein